MLSMKKIFLFLTVLTLINVSFKIYGQTEQGIVLLGGETNLNYTSMNSTLKSGLDEENMGSNSKIEFSPQVGFFVKNGLALGLEVSGSIENSKDKDGNKVTSTSFVFAPFFKGYFGSGNVKPYLMAEAGLGSMSYISKTSGITDDDESLSMVDYSFEGGMAIFFNDRASIDIGLGYGINILKPNNSSSETVQLIKRGLYFGVGVNLFL
jgi:outer membrane protein